MLKFLILAAFIPALVLGQATPVRVCTGGRPSPHEVRVLGCTAAPCDVPQGTTAIMEVDFRAESGAETLRPQVMATALGVTVEYTLHEDFHDACQHLQSGSSCPLDVNEDAFYEFRFGVTSIYPPIPVAVELSLLNEAGDSVFCTIIDIHVRLGGSS